MKRPPCEADLKGQDHERFGDAMVLCQDASGACAEKGCCTFDGDCFKPNSIDYRRAHKLLEQLIQSSFGSETGGVRTWLCTARDSMERTYRIETGE